MDKVVVVNDKMQSNYRYHLMEPIGENFDPVSARCYCTGRTIRGKYSSMVVKDEIELELAWLVKSLPKDYKRYKSANIKQAYLQSSESCIKDIRAREKDGVYTLTEKRFIKSPQETGYTQELTKKLRKEEFLNFWKKSKKRIRKVRYYYPLDNDLVAEIDIYKNNLEGLIVVEVEFPTIPAYKKFVAPGWFGKEVTDSKGIYPPHIANMKLEEIDKINKAYNQKSHEFE